MANSAAAKATKTANKAAPTNARLAMVSMGSEVENWEIIIEINCCCRLNWTQFFASLYVRDESNLISNIARRDQDYVTTEDALVASRRPDKINSAPASIILDTVSKHQNYHLDDLLWPTAINGDLVDCLLKVSEALIQALMTDQKWSSSY